MSSTLMDMAVDLIPERWGLHAMEKHVLVQLGRMASNTDDDCDPGVPFIGRRTGLSVQSVRRAIRALSDGGWIAVMPQERRNGGTSSNRYRLNWDKIVNAATIQRDEERRVRAEFAAGKRVAAQESGDDPEVSDANAPPLPVGKGAPTTQEGGPYHTGRGMLTDANSNNTPRGAGANEAWETLESQVMDIIRPVADMTAPGVLVTYPIKVLLEATEGSPACTPDEVLAGARKAAAWFAARPKLRMSHHDTLRKMAIEYRDLRLAGAPVKVEAKPAGPSLGDPAGFDRDRWVMVIDISNARGGAWKPEWGPAPGEAGSFVPADLVGTWKGNGSRAA